MISCGVRAKHDDILSDHMMPVSHGRTRILDYNARLVLTIDIYWRECTLPCISTAERGWPPSEILERTHHWTHKHLHQEHASSKSPTVGKYAGPHSSAL